MCFSYRILKDKDGLFSVKEIYYDDDGIWAFTENGMSLSGFESKEDIIADVKLILKAIEHQADVLNEETILKDAPLHPRNIELNDTWEKIKSGEIKTIPLNKLLDEFKEEKEEKNKDKQRNLF